MADRIARKVLLVGWDAADWKLITPLLERGLLPNLEQVIDGGVMGNLATLRPILSPLLWNSIATGKRPHQHGILGFVEPDPHAAGIRPVSSTSRRVKAIWNILTQRGLRAHVIDWFAGHPAEPINGVCVSPLYAHPSGSADKPWPLSEGSVHPERLRDTMAALRVHPGQLPPEALLAFVPRAAEVDQQQDRHLHTLARALARCASVHNAATWALEHEPCDFMAVYFNAIDNVGHHFMRFHPPRMADVHPRQFELYKDVVAGIYRFHDMLLGRLLELAGPDATVMLVSDHGFHSNHLRPGGSRGGTGGPESWHRDFGIVCLRGPHIRRDERIYGASILDVTPTVLMLLGLPVGRDMAGKPLVQALEKPVEVERIPSWEDEPGESGMHPPDQRTDPEAADAVLQQFVALGYVARPGEDQTRARARVIREARFNLARSYIEARRSRQALPILEELAAGHPGHRRFALALARCYLRIGRRKDVRRVLERLLDVGGGGPWTDWLLGVIEFEDGHPDSALVFLKRAEAAQVQPGLPLRIGHLYLRKRRLDDARRAFESVLAIDPESPRAHLGLAMVALRERRDAEAAERALTAVSLQHLLPAGHYHLGVALTRLGQYERASLAFETAVHMQPTLVNARRWLARLKRRAGDDIGAARHQLAVDQRRGRA